MRHIIKLFKFIYLIFLGLNKMKLGTNNNIFFNSYFVFNTTQLHGNYNSSYKNLS